MSLNQNVWHDHATMQQNVLLHISLLKSGWNMKKNILLSSSRAFSLSTPMENSKQRCLSLFWCLPGPVENSEATWKKATKCDKYFVFGWFIDDKIGNHSSEKRCLFPYSIFIFVNNLLECSALIVKKRISCVFPG